MNSKGILLVANKQSEQLCENLIYSIRETGCSLPIVIIHFGGEQITSEKILNAVKYVKFEEFSSEAKEIIYKIKSVLTECPTGFLYRFLGWYLDWDEFIYSDNDIVALSNWEELFLLEKDADLIHSDFEFKTQGIYNFKDRIKAIEKLGSKCMDNAITAGHILIRKKQQHIEDMIKALDWITRNREIPKLHDQSFLLITSIIGNWNVVNLCKEPYLYIDPWSGSYRNPLAVIIALQTNKKTLTHLHYSGFKVQYQTPIQELLLSYLSNAERNSKVFFSLIKLKSGFTKSTSIIKKINKKLERILNTKRK